MVAGCHRGASGSDGDTQGDALPALLSCPTPMGPAFITSSYGFLPPDQGFDLVGDGRVHNELGVLAPFANNYFAETVKIGTSIFLEDFPGLPNPLVDETNFPFYFFTGISAHDPPDPSANVSGMGQFLIPLKQYNVNCQPTTRFTNTVISGHTLTAEAKRVDIVAQAIGDFEVSNARWKATFSDDEQTISGSIGAAAVSCALNKLVSPLSGNLTMLDTVVSAFKLQPDLDLDHDGLDHFVTDGSQVTACIKADGTQIAGHNCACDPRIGDAYSLALFFTAVRAQIVGFAMGQ